MLTVQRLADIACRHDTAMADAMLAACVERALRTGEALVPRHRPCKRHRLGTTADPFSGVDWERLVRCNADIRSLFCRR